MATGSFPDDPSNRRAILVLQQHDIERCGYEPGEARLLLDEEAYVLQLPVRPQGEVSIALRNIVDAGLARPGTMLVQSPFDPDAYEEASLAPQRFALAKHMYFSTLCMHLGAKEVSVKQVDLRIHTGNTSVDVSLDAKVPVGGAPLPVRADLSVAKKELERFRAQMNLRDEFAGGPPNVDAAERLLRRTGLLADPNMRTLIEMRRDGANQLLTRELVLNLSSEVKNNLNVAMRLKVPTSGKLSVESEHDQEDQYEYKLTVTVKF